MGILEGYGVSCVWRTLKLDSSGWSCSKRVLHLGVLLARRGVSQGWSVAIVLILGNYRIERAARALPIGTLRPSIVLYDENHPLGEQIGDLQVFDLYRKPDLLLIMGTSLKVHGLKRVVREFAKAVHAKKGLVVFVNLTPPSKEWEDVIDIHIQGETDRWVESVEADWKSYKPADWEIQTTLHGEVVKDARRTTKGKPGPKPKKSECMIRWRLTSRSESGTGAIAHTATIAIT